MAFLTTIHLNDVTTQKALETAGFTNVQSVSRCSVWRKHLLPGGSIELYLEPETIARLPSDVMKLVYIAGIQKGSRDKEIEITRRLEHNMKTFLQKLTYDDE